MTNPPGGHALDCARARDLIDAFLLDELEPADAARLAAHVKGCPACAAEIGGSTRVLGLLGTLSTPRPLPDLDERILVAAFEDRRRRHEHRSWLSDLRTQVIRGAMRTTGTLIVTIMTVALLGGAFVFAASQVVAQLPPFQPPARATLDTSGDAYAHAGIGCPNSPAGIGHRDTTPELGSFGDAVDRAHHRSDTHAGALSDAGAQREPQPVGGAVRLAVTIGRADAHADR